MPKRIIGVSERLLVVSKEEFLDKGFEGASIKEIASKADTSPRAIYTRFANKEDLFYKVVEPVVMGFNRMFIEDKEYYYSGKSEKGKTPTDFYIRYIEYAYEHKEEFILLLTKASGTRFEHFTRDLAETDCRGVNEVISEGKINVKNNLEVAELFMKQISYAFYDNLFVPVIRGYNVEEAKEYVSMLVDFYMKGIATSRIQ